MKLNKQQSFFCSFLLIFSLGLNAQLIVEPLGSNGIQANKIPGKFTTFGSVKSASRSTLTLPFIEDFSYSWHFSDANKWVDNHQVYINSELPIKPPSIGVATFDGLDGNGNPYSNLEISGGADTLTSLPINLSGKVPGDSIYLSFFYQPRGRGNFPEFRDTFVLEFKVPQDTLWKHVWSIRGEDYPQAYRDFKSVMIPVRDTALLKDSFQFRFRNYAQLNGSWDHWHLDYVRLDENRNINDTTFADVAFMYRPSSLLNTYQSIPLHHYLPNALGHMAETYKISLTNNAIGNTNKLYKYLFYNENLVQVDEFIDAQGPIGFRQQFEFSEPVKYVYEDPGPNHEYTSYYLKHFIDGVDNNSRNDTAVYEQILSNYYALDDGSAEERISLSNNGGGFVAQRFDTYLSDTLKSVQFYFNRANNGPVDQPFYIMVWAAGSNIPGTLLSSEEITYPQYDGLNTFYTYNLATPLYLPSGTYYIGWAQTGSFNLNVGFDKNFDNSDRIFYNLTGNWYNYSAGQGTMMIRPLFKLPYNPYVGIPKSVDNSEEWNISPNPVDQSLNCQRTASTPVLLNITDLAGRMVLTQEWNTLQLNISTGKLPAGIYLIHITDPVSGVRSVKRLAIRH